MVKQDILILGAGPSGLAAAFELHRSGKSCTVIERDKQVGGLSKTLSYGDFRTDIGPHRFYSQNKYLYCLIEDLLGKRWIRVDRITSFYISGNLFLYPIKITDALIKVGPYTAFRILTDYLFEKFKHIFIKTEPQCFEDFIISNFGRTLAKLNMLNYTEKIWGIPSSKISPDWARQRIKGLSLREAVSKALKKSKGGPKTLIDQFFYPDTGSGLIYEKIKERISINGDSEVITNNHPTRIFHNTDRITKVVISGVGGGKIYKPAYVISSIPITEFVNLLDPSAPIEILQEIRHLKFRSHVSLFLTINRPLVFKDQWIYFPDKEIPFGRIMEPKNFSEMMSPEDKTSLRIEFFCWENDRIWNTSKDDLFELGFEWLEKLGFIKRREVIGYYVHKEKYAYPVYDLNYKGHLDKVKQYLSRFSNLQLIGRSGCFRYNNQDHALEMGILAARGIIDGKKYNIEEIGAGQEYFERGYLS